MPVCEMPQLASPVHRAAGHGQRADDDACLADLPPPFSGVDALQWHEGHVAEHADRLAEEVPVALEYNGVAHAVMLATPVDLEDFATGFSISEGIVADASEIFDIEVEPGHSGLTVRLRIAGAAFAALKTRRRALAGRTGCGLCGVESLAQLAPRVASRNAGDATRVDARALHAGFAELKLRQALLGATGATHAAAWLRADGTLACVREDVGRHNALDKLIGALLRQRETLAGGAALVTSRASYEMVQKTANVGIGVLAAISGPTALAVRLADQAGITLAGFVRPGRHVVYSHPKRLVPNVNSAPGAI